MQAAWRRGKGELWPMPLQGVQLHAVAMQAACRRGMQVGIAACNWGALCVAERAQRKAGGRQAACRSKRPGPAKIPFQNSILFAIFEY